MPAVAKSESGEISTESKETKVCSKVYGSISKTTFHKISAGAVICTIWPSGKGIICPPPNSLVIHWVKQSALAIDEVTGFLAI